MVEPRPQKNSGNSLVSAEIRDPDFTSLRCAPCSPRDPNHNGQGGIRTHDTVTGIPVFETGSFSHSDTCPNEPSIVVTARYIYNPSSTQLGRAQLHAFVSNTLQTPGNSTDPGE